MKCQYCGKDLAPGSLFCEGCGAKIEAEAPVMHEQHQNVNYGGMPPQKKGNTGLKVTIVILSILLVAAIVGLILFFVLKGDGDSEKKENGNQVVNNGGNNNNNNHFYDDDDDDDDYDYDYDDDDDDDDDYNYNNNNNNNNYGGNNTLSCSGEMEGQDLDITLYYDSTGTKLTKFDMNMTMDLSEMMDYFEGFDISMIEESFKEEVCKSGNYSKCDLSVRGNNLYVNVSGSDPSDINDYTGGAINEARAQLEEEGFTCR